ncbi:MAG: replicative DNA helicase [Anaerovoracaceae bacterium]|nr:replicative DNA helicase [Bacillota bacterium]MDY2670713.1 replicative DNA helicase [Anaerovoracaceae bacterium]
MADNMERIPPHSDEAEKSVLGAIMIDKNALFDVLEALKPEDFYSEIHAEIFDAVRDINRRSAPVDSITVKDELQKRKKLQMVGGPAYIASLSAGVPSTANVMSYAAIIREKAMLRSLIRVSSDIMDKSFAASSDAETVLDKAEQEILDISRFSQKREYTPLKDVLWTNMEEIDAMASRDGTLTGLTTGFVDLDARTSGLQKSDLVIVAARPSMGKTAFALNIAQNAAVKSGAHVMIFSLEMSKEQLGQRMLSMESCIELSRLRTGDISREDWEDLNIAIDKLSDTNVFIDDTPGISIAEMKNKCRRVKAERGLDLVVVDYLQLMSIEGSNEGRQQEVSTLSRMLKQMAREMECPVVVLSQLSRAVEQRQDHKPQLSDLRESGAIEQDADVVMFLYRDEYYNPETTEKPNTCEIIIAKQRNGPTGSLDLAWLGKYTKFADKSPVEL